MTRTSTPVGFVTGFLGSGKTTLIQQALAHPDLRNTAVIINEFGEIGLDHLMVETSTETVIELRNGCICCTIHQDLALTLRDLHARRLLGDIPAFDYVLVETTGLADPGPLLHTLTVTPAFKGVFHPDAVITCVDLCALGDTVAAHRTAADQVAMADLLVLTKGDLATRSQKAAALVVLDAINPDAERVCAPHGDIDPMQLFRRGLYQPPRGRMSRWLGVAAGAGGAAAPSRRHDHGAEYMSCAFRADDAVSLAGLTVFLNRLVNSEHGEVLRVKGVLRFRERDGRAAIVHGVRGKFHPLQWLDAWPDPQIGGCLIVIGRNLVRQEMEAGFEALCR
ncbi:MAG: GTP-binding protein [Gammaproteobacteria bacterium]|jgi:G3E family GTPase|nr:GTP-binding protein [Gammaproteobacteria bacterium]MBU0773552.1 GTP-binding protein [Gammaproteobacteria bacterium]MBU0857684.1 GTP-binding protein [Gammaproteobacteria bacterium]MBU1848100.1 GTP-binding protein [Gammaproteobacteria bacterium]